MTIEEKAKAYDEALERARKLYNDAITLQLEQDIKDYEQIFPELKESESERIRKGLINYFNHHKNGINIFYGIKGDDILAWLEKQESVNEIVSRCRTSWYNEGKIAGMAEGLTDDEKYQQGWHDALEKQDECHISHDDEIMIKQLTEYFTTGHGLQNTNETVVEWLNDVKEKLEKRGEVESDNDDIEVEEKGIREAFNKIEDEKQCKQKPQRMISAEAKEAMYAKTAWSEEDEKMLADACIMLDWYNGNNWWKAQHIKNWLKSLKQRYTWKPSDEQIKVCKEVYADLLSAKGFDVGTINSELNRLEEQLKKLKE